ncbi:MAG: hypothetical protein H6838_10445 [Planctomycetes bacterium]|nr:hypothetical protein [Planctomycetota bacterium]
MRLLSVIHQFFPDCHSGTEQWFARLQVRAPSEIGRNYDSFTRTYRGAPV